MADDPDEAERFDLAISSIKRHFDREEFDEALPFCVKACEMRPDSAVVRRCRIFALLSLSRWADALQMCEKNPAEQEALAFERAYCLYRLNRFQEALDAVAQGEQSPDEQARRARLEAQVRYRMGDYQACADMYEKLYGDDAEDTGLLVNAVASGVSGGKPREALRMLLDQDSLLDSSYELCFNLACALIDEGRLTEAEERLQKAKDLCSAEILQSEEPEDEVSLEDHEELAAIRVQEACVLQRRGKSEEAADIYNRVLRQRSGKAREVDVTVLAVACNNVVALRSEGKSLFDSLKRINVASKESLEHKLTRKQTIEIAINKCLLLMQAHRVEEARRELQRLRDSFPGHPRVAVIQAAIAFKEKKTKQCEEMLQAYLTENPGNEDVLLALAQLHAQQHRIDRAVEALTQLPLERRAQPRTAEAIAALHRQQKSPEKAAACLREAIDYWAGKGGGDADDEETLASVLRIAARLAMQLKDKAFAAEVFRLYLERIDGSDVDALCGLVQALASTDPEKAEQYAQRLQVPSYSHFDPEELEGAPVPKMGSVPKKKGDKEEGADAEAGKDAEQEKSKPKRKRKPRYPKGFDPENPGPPPDPERWLPKRERAEFKKRMRKRDKNLLRGPQGSMPTDDNAFRKQGPSTAQIEVSKDSAKPSKGRKPKGKK